LAERDAIAAERDAAAFKAQQALEEIEKLKALLAAKKS
jgi:HEPN domain-containing protein